MYQGAIGLPAQREYFRKEVTVVYGLEEKRSRVRNERQVDTVLQRIDVTWQYKKARESTILKLAHAKKENWRHIIQ